MQQGLGAAPQRFSVGGVIGASLPILRRNFWHFFAVALVAGIPLLILTLLLSKLVRPMTAPAAMEASMNAAEVGTALLSIVVGFLGVLTYFVIQSAINYGTLQDLRGERPAVGRCLSRGLAVLPRVFAASLALFLALFAMTVVAAMAFYGVAMVLAASSGHGPTIGAVSAAATVGVLILALLLFVTWWVFVPAIVVENAAPIAAFRRSRRLTKGHRWGILGIVVLVFISNFACSILVRVIGMLGAIATATLLNIVLALAFTALSGVLTAVGYYALRAEKENFGLGDLARIFD